MASKKKIVMLTTSERGGIASVVDRYERDGLFEHWNVILVVTHVEGSLRARLARAAASFGQVFMLAMRGRVALLHCHVSMYGSFWRKSLFAMMARMFHIPVLFHLHGSKTKEFYQGLPQFAQRLADRQLAAASVVLVLSESWREFVLGLAPSARVVVLPNYVDIPQRMISDIRQTGAAESGRNQVTVLFLGLIGERKGVYDLLRAFAGAASCVPHLHLRVAGNGEMEKARHLADELRLHDRVDFPGWVDAQARNELLAEADIFVLPSYNEGLPVSVLEAMAWALPVITTPVGGIPELITHQIEGILVPPGDVAGLQAWLETLADDANLRRRLGDAARDVVRHRFSRENTLPELTALYARFTAESPELAQRPN